ncbi:sensor histidine kinase [Arthrobacter sp. L77]|uniref:sensor histidine kinase n=1 Tax=Arthrobacter sp. L77 TaxID=1496689 RepID=UPI0005BA1915|nr:histidine kinase [Arthrobacter sp. L77]
MSSIVDSRPPTSHLDAPWSGSGAGNEQAVQQHDQVIQRLFAAGLRIQGLRKHLADREALERISLVSAELDAAIRDLRRTIHSLQSGPPTPPTFSAGVLAVVAATARDHALQPELHLTGPLDAGVHPVVADHVRAILEEGLCRALRDATTASITVTLRVLRGRLEMGISDNGSGFAEPPSCRGLTAMRRHAELCAGTLSVSSSPGEGTRVLLIVPGAAAEREGTATTSVRTVGVRTGLSVVRG